MEEKMKEKEINKPKKKKKLPAEDFQFSEDKIQAMKNLAQQISKSLSASKKTEEEEQPVKKTSYQLELEEERRKKLEETEFLKTLTPTELRDYNRKKLNQKDDSDINKIDDHDTNVDFSKALEITEKTAEIYHKFAAKEADESEAAQKYSSLINQVAKKEDDRGKRKKRKKDKKVDKSGKVDGEVVEGLVKREVKKNKEKKSVENNVSQDDYVLEKLFNKKG